MTTPAKPRQDTLFPGLPKANPGAYGDGRRKGVYDDARCPVCGTDWGSHTPECPRHAFRPAVPETPKGD